MFESLKIPEEDRKILHQNGWAIVSLIAAINIILTVIFMLPNFNIFMFSVSVILTFALYYGVSWVKYLHAISFIVYFFVLIDILTQIPPDSSIWILIFNLILMIYSVAIVWFLLISKSVREFLHSQKCKRKQAMKAAMNATVDRE